MANRRIWRRLLPGRRTWKLFLYTLPFTFWPMVQGITQGIYMEKFTNIHHEEVKSSFEFQHQMDTWTDQWSVPGAPGIHDMPIEPFHLVPLRNTKWWKQLGLIKPNADLASTAHFHRIGAPDGLVAEFDSESTAPTSHWVYIAQHGFILFDPWDIVFDQLLQYHYVHPPAQNASIHYIDPGKASFLSKLWFVDAPALVHFQVDTSSPVINSETQLPVISRNGLPLYEVKMRVAELGHPIFRPNEFPDRFEQLLFLTSGEFDTEDLIEWDWFYQSSRRFKEWTYRPNINNKYLEALDVIDDWIEAHVDSSTYEWLELLSLFYFALSWVTVSAPRVLYFTLLEPLWHRFVAYPRPSEDGHASLFGEATDDEKMWRNPLLGGAMLAFLENLTDVFAAQQNESASSAAAEAVTSTLATS